jgi:ABC-2 type transport system ATP-binding protein
VIQLASSGAQPVSGAAIEVENLVKIYRSRTWSLSGRKTASTVPAVDGISFSVPRGHIIGLLGPNGAGKTTLLKMLTTLLIPSSGHIRIEGFDPVTQPLDVRRRIVVVLQETAVELFLSVRENLLTFARFHNIPRAEALRRADDLLTRFQLTDDASRKVMDLSGGSRRRVQVAKVFLVQTPIIFLDEFSTGMDPILKRAVMGYLREEAARGRTIVLTTQILNEAEELCDDILIMNHGRLVARGNLDTLKLLSQGVYEISMTFDALPAGIADDIAALAPLRFSMRQNTLDIALKIPEGDVLQTVTRLARGQRLLRVEVNGASLEDIFIELTEK